jgi:hypothetical protein
MGWAAARPERTWAIEGAIGLGHLLARQLVPAGEQMLDIQPKVAGRVRLRGLASTGHRMSGSVPPPTVSISLSPRRIVGVPCGYLLPDTHPICHALRSPVDRLPVCPRQE